MWCGIVLALLLCLATAVAYAEISRLYPGQVKLLTMQKQALLSKDKAFKYARVAKFIVGWARISTTGLSGVMVATHGHFCRLRCRLLYPTLMSGSNPGRSSWPW